MAWPVAAVATAALLGVASATPSVLFASPQELPAAWAVRGSASPTYPVKVHVALQRRNMDLMTEVVAAVTDPDSERYTEYWPSDKIAATTTDTAAVAAVSEWLTESGVEFTVSKAGGMITLDTTARTVENLFETSIAVLHNGETGQKAIRATDIHVPTTVATHVEAVFGVHDLPLPPRRNIVTEAPMDDDAGGNPASVTPGVINTAYGVSGVTASGSTKNRQAVAEFQGQLLNSTDLKTFFKNYVKGANKDKNTVYKFVGDQQQGEGVEANLDIQYIMGVAPGVLTEAWQYAGMGFCTDLKQWTQAILAETNPPNVFSVSYGWQGDMSQIGCSSSQITSIDADFKSIAAQGVGIIFASGDSGSAYNGQKCYASWPASSLYVTAVGATRFEKQQDTQPERAVDQFGSGGGFSMLISPAPQWQSAAISSFYSNEAAGSLPPSSDYGKGGRGTPDVAALGEGFQVIERGSPIAVGGTSASAPTFSGLVSLVNDALIAKGMKPMGNLNAFIYKNSDVFTDITKGSDRVGRGGQQLSEGFDAVKGWDPVTGFGTMKFAKFLAAAEAAQA